MYVNIISAVYYLGSLFKDVTNPDLESRCKKGMIEMSMFVCTSRHHEFSVGDKISGSVHLVANESSMGFFRIEEHIRRSLPDLVTKRVSNI